MSNKTKKQLEAELKQVRADLDAANKTLSVDMNIMDADEKCDLLESIENLKADLKKYKSYNSDLSHELELASREIQGYQLQIGELKNRRSDLNAIVSGLSMKVRVYQCLLVLAGAACTFAFWVLS